MIRPAFELADLEKCDRDDILGLAARGLTLEQIVELANLPPTPVADLLATGATTRVFIPTPTDIANRSKVVRDGWTAAERVKRTVQKGRWSLMTISTVEIEGNR